jgi:UDP-glucose 4-epimerase
MIIVTGSNGLLGKEVSNFLEQKDYEVLKISRQNFNLQTKSLLSLKNVPSAIIHLAAVVPTSLTSEDSVESSEITKKIDSNVIEAAKFWNCKLIYASSCAVYKKEITLKNELSEIDTESNSPYVLAKIAGEKKTLQLSNSVVCRLPALVGKNMMSKSILCKFLKTSLDDEVIELWNDGSREQNFLDVYDVSNAFELILNMKTDNKIFNIANSKTMSMKELALIIISITKKGSVSFKEIQDPNEELCVSYDVNLAKKLLKWEPKTNIAQTIKGILKNANP